MKKSDPASSDVPKPQTKHAKSSKNSAVKWSLTILLWSFVLSVLFNAISETALKEVSLLPAFLILGAIVFINIVFDIFGIAAATASEKPFHAMSSRRVRGAKQALWLVRNAEKVSSFCNDVVGDICGILSGSTAAIIIAGISFASDFSSAVIPLIITGVVAGVTVGGKAFCKGIAISHSNDIVFFMAKIIRVFSRAD